MKLEGRLGLILQMMPRGNCLGDIGTDHAYIPAAVISSGLFDKAIATDIRSGPLERAARTLQKERLSEQVELREGPGLHPIQPEECDVFVMAGMGALMITSILQDNPATAKKAGCLLLQPMHAQERLRPWLRANGYLLLAEALAESAGKRYQVLAVCHGESKGIVASDRWQPWPRIALPGLPNELEDPLYDRVGYGIVNGKDPLAKKWLTDWITRQRRVVEGLERSGRYRAKLQEEACSLKALEHCEKVLSWNMAG